MTSPRKMFLPRTICFPMFRQTKPLMYFKKRWEELTINPEHVRTRKCSSIPFSLATHFGTMVRYREIGTYTEEIGRRTGDRHGSRAVNIQSHQKAQNTSSRRLDASTRCESGDIDSKELPKRQNLPERWKQDHVISPVNLVWTETVLLFSAEKNPSQGIFGIPFCEQFLPIP